MGFDFRTSNSKANRRLICASPFMGIDLSLKLEKEEDEESSKHSCEKKEEEEDDDASDDGDEQMVKEVDVDDSCLGSRTRKEENEREEVPTIRIHISKYLCVKIC